jgi:hypothetical protein
MLITIKYLAANKSDDIIQLGEGLIQHRLWQRRSHETFDFVFASKRVLDANHLLTWSLSVILCQNCQIQKQLATENINMNMN